MFELKDGADPTCIRGWVRSLMVRSWNALDGRTPPYMPSGPIMVEHDRCPNISTRFTWSGGSSGLTLEID